MFFAAVLCGLFRFVSRGTKAVPEKQGRPTENRHISEIEGWPVVCPEMEIQKVGDRLIPQPIDDIAKCAADDQTERSSGQSIWRAP